MSVATLVSLLICAACATSLDDGTWKTKARIFGVLAGAMGVMFFSHGIEVPK